MKGKEKKWDSLIQETTKAVRKCGTCRDVAQSDLTDLMQTLHDKGARKVSIAQIYKIMGKACPGFTDRIGFHAFRMHVTHHELLWLGRKEDSDQ